MWPITNKATVKLYVVVAGGLHVRAVGPADGAERVTRVESLMPGVRRTIYYGNARGPATRITGYEHDDDDDIVDLNTLIYNS